MNFFNKVYNAAKDVIARWYQQKNDEQAAIQAEQERRACMVTAGQIRYELGTTLKSMNVGPELVAISNCETLTYAYFKRINGKYLYLYVWPKTTPEIINNARLNVIRNMINSNLDLRAMNVRLQIESEPDPYQREQMYEYCVYLLNGFRVVSLVDRMYYVEIGVTCLG